MTIELTDEQTAKIFAANCVCGKNLATEYDECIKKAKAGLSDGKSFEQVREEIKADLRAKYGR